MKKIIIFTIISIVTIFQSLDTHAIDYQMPISIFTNSILWMPFSQATGFYGSAKTPDFSSEHNDGDVIGATFDNGSYSFDGNDFITGSVNVTLPYSFSCWVKLDDLDYRCSLSMSTGNNAYYTSINYYGGNRFIARSYSSTGIKDATFTFGNIDEWVHIVGVFTSLSHRQIYVNGEAGTVNTSVIGTPGTGRYTIGVTADSTPVNYFDGNIDDPRIFDRALTSSEITYLYNSTTNQHGN